MTAAVSELVKKVKVVLGFSGMSDVDLLKRLDAVINGMAGSLIFVTPPVDIASFKAEVHTFDTLVTEALDGGKKAISAKRKQRDC